MLTIIQLSRSLYEQVEQAALRELVTLEQFIAEAIEQKVRSSRTVNASRQRVQLPLVRSKRPGSRELTGERVGEILNVEDVSA